MELVTQKEIDNAVMSAILCASQWGDDYVMRVAEAALATGATFDVVAEALETVGVVAGSES